MEVNGFIIEPQSGNAGADIPISISVPEENDDLDRVVEITAVCGDKASHLTLIHEGMREILYASDGILYASDDTTLNVLKE